MSKLLKTVAGASLLMFAATTVIAQTTPNTSSGQNQPGQAQTDSNAAKDQKPTDPNLPKTQPERTSAEFYLFGIGQGEGAK